MFEEKDLLELLNLKTEDPILSLYINLYPEGGGAEKSRLNLQNLLKPIKLDEDVKAIEKYIEHEHTGKGESLVIFSCKNSLFFKAISLHLPVINQIRYLHRPVLSPLIGMMEAFSRWGIVIVDRQGARILLFHLGELFEMEGYLGEEVQQIKRGGGTSFHGRKGSMGGSSNIQNIISKNIHEIVDHTTNIFSSNKIRRLIICGTDENISLFRANLPKTWQSLIASTFHLSMISEYEEIREKTMEVIKQTSKILHEDLIEKAITLAAKGEGGVTGLDDTLLAMRNERIQTLLVLNSYSETGYLCNTCKFMTTQKLEECPFCKGKFLKIENAVEYSIIEAKKNNATVHIIHQSENLEKAGMIAAILRY